MVLNVSQWFNLLNEFLDVDHAALVSKYVFGCDFPGNFPDCKQTDLFVALSAITSLNITIF